MIFSPNKIVVHHSATPSDLPLMKSIASFDKNHKERLQSPKSKLGYHVAYHFVIAWDWSHLQCRDIDEIARHASNMVVNNSSIGICFTWNFDVEKPTEAQLKKFVKIKQYLEKELWPLPIHFHNEYASKSCPGKNMTVELIQKTLLTSWNVPESFSSLYKAVFAGENRTFMLPEQAIAQLQQVYEEEGGDWLIRELLYLIAILTTKIDLASKWSQPPLKILFHDIPDSCSCNK